MLIPNRMPLAKNMDSSACKVLIAAHSSARGGAEYCLDTFLTHLDRSRIDPIVVFPDEGPLSRSCRDLRHSVQLQPTLPWIYVEKNIWYWKNLIGKSWLNVLNIVRLIRKEKIEVVYSSTSSIFEPAIAAKLTGKPHIWHVHEVLNQESETNSLLTIRWLKWLINYLSDCIIFESHAAQEAFGRTNLTKKSEVVPNSLRLKSDETANNYVVHLREQLSIEEDAKVVLFAGQFIDRKNPIALLEALKIIPESQRPICVLVGDGPLKSNCLQFAKNNGLNSHTRFLPFEEDLRPHFALCDLLALPSKQESFGLVLIEAAIFSKPSIAFASQGPSEIIVDKETGFLVENQNIREMAGRIVEIVTSNKLARELGRNARERVQKLYDPRKNSQIIEDLIEGAKQRQW